MCQGSKGRTHPIIVYFTGECLLILELIFMLSDFSISHGVVTETSR